MISQNSSVKWWVLTDALPHSCIGKLSELIPAQPHNIKVYIDHDTPCGSITSSEVQRAVIDFALRWGCDLKNGEGISCQDMLDNYVKEGDIVACMSEFPSVYGANNATGVAMTSDEWFASAKKGEIGVGEIADEVYPKK